MLFRSERDVRGWGAEYAEQYACEYGYYARAGDERVDGGGVNDAWWGRRGVWGVSVWEVGMAQGRRGGLDTLGT